MVIISGVPIFRIFTVTMIVLKIGSRIYLNMSEYSCRCFCNSYKAASTVCDTTCQSTTQPDLSGSLQSDGTFLVSVADPVASSTTSQVIIQVTVFQSIVSLTSSLSGQLIKCFTSL